MQVCDTTVSEHFEGSTVYIECMHIITECVFVDSVNLNAP